jgi:acetate---CoA ligase (ADP-forming)
MELSTTSSLALPDVEHSLHSLFAPQAIAVVGAGRRRGSIGAEILHNVMVSGFRGAIYPVNPHAATVEGLRAYERLTDVAGPIDLAVIAVPCDAVESAIDDCIAKHVPNVVIISAGFSETGTEGRAHEARLRDKLRRAGARLVGPNCMGLVNTDPSRPLNATFSPVFPPAGPIAFSSQSGALGLAVLESAKRLNLGLSSFVSVGNKADVSTNDLLEYWEHDPRTSVILMYVESFGNPQRFAQLAKRIAHHKPIIALKAGRSSSGARAASSHTGALAASDDIVDALFRDAGVIRTTTVEEMFETAALLAHQPLPQGKRVAILTNAGGPGILAADACEAHGLTVGPLAPATRDALKAFLPTSAGLSNPVDMIATATADDYRRAIPLLLNDPGIDSVITIFIPPIVTRASEVASAIADTARGANKPVLATFFGAAGVPDLIAPVPCYTFPESAARALGHAVTYARWRSQPSGQIPELRAFDVRSVRQIMERSEPSPSGWLEPHVVSAILESCGIQTAPIRVVVSAEGAVAAARHLGLPVVLKGSGPQLIHKTESHAVVTNLRTDADVMRAYHALARRPDIDCILVQPMVTHGVEMFVGATLDPSFGPVVMCGTGGILLELVKDTSCRLAPITERGAREMLEDIRGRVLLRGFRGAPPADEAGFVDVVLRTSALIHACPQIAELDLNPVIVTANAAIVVDARIRVA